MAPFEAVITLMRVDEEIPGGRQRALPRPGTVGRCRRAHRRSRRRPA
ncbi:MAG: hypothetical protein R2710_12770 [Acidimicrobiales bacterium]